MKNLMKKLSELDDADENEIENLSDEQMKLDLLVGENLTQFSKRPKDER